MCAYKQLAEQADLQLLNLFDLKVFLSFVDWQIFKCPMRDACLYMGEATPPDPHFLFAIALQP